MGYDNNECLFCYMSGFGNNDVDEQHGCCRECCSGIDSESSRVAREINDMMDFSGECELCGKQAHFKMISICDHCFSTQQKPRLPGDDACVVCFLRKNESHGRVCEPIDLCGNCMNDLLRSSDGICETGIAIAKSNFSFDGTTTCHVCDGVAVSTLTICNDCQRSDAEEHGRSAADAAV